VEICVNEFDFAHHGVCGEREVLQLPGRFQDDTTQLNRMFDLRR
jgi:hypothetical protein